MNRTSLAELEAVATVARVGGFRAAARKLGVSPSALSHSIAALEDRLHVRLFNRTTRSVALTAAGETFVAEVAPALAAIDGALENASEGSSEISGALRINTSRGAAAILLQPLFLRYVRRYPRVELEIATEEALVDVLGQGFDAGIRLADTVPPDMIAVPILPTIRSLVVGAPAYFVGRERPVAPADLMRHQCIRARMGTGKLYRWEFEKRGQVVLIDAPGFLTLDESGLMLARISQETTCIGAANQRKMLCDRLLCELQEFPRWKRTVARRYLILHRSKSARWWPVSTQGR
jgi:DNA-binding transcriptional LysR family regulator